MDDTQSQDQVKDAFAPSFAVHWTRGMLASLPGWTGLAMLMLSPWRTWWPLAAGLSILLLLWSLRVFICHGFRPCPDTVLALSGLGENVFSLRLGDGRRLRGRLMDGSVVHPYLFALRFRGDDGRIYRLIHPFSKRESRAARAVRIALLQARAAPAEHPNPSA